MHYFHISSFFYIQFDRICEITNEIKWHQNSTDRYDPMAFLDSPVSKKKGKIDMMTNGTIMRVAVWNNRKLDPEFSSFDHT